LHGPATVISLPAGKGIDEASACHQNPFQMVAMISRLLLPTAALAFALSSCGLSPYSRDFEAELATMARPPLTSEGPWLGSWQSDVNGHHGPLWCMVRPACDRAGYYDFRYRAGWGILRFGDYTHTTLASVTRGGSLALAGSMTLPGGLGTYQVKGRLTRDSFDATYRSAADHGTLTLRRPSPQPEERHGLSAAGLALETSTALP
jgi:hypothetical protein